MTTSNALPCGCRHQCNRHAHFIASCRQVCGSTRWIAWRLAVHFDFRYPGPFTTSPATVVYRYRQVAFLHVHAMYVYPMQQHHRLVCPSASELPVCDNTLSQGGCCLARSYPPHLHLRHPARVDELLQDLRRAVCHEVWDAHSVLLRGGRREGQIVIYISGSICSSGCDFQRAADNMSSA